MDDWPLVLPSPIIARSTVPRGRRRTEQLSYPDWLIRSLVVEMILLRTSPELTQGISPSQNLSCFLEGVLPLTTVPTAPTRHATQESGTLSNPSSPSSTTR